MNKRSEIVSLISIIVASTAILLVAFKPSNKKIGYIRSAEIVYQYKGMQEARAAYEIENNQWNSKLDSLNIQIQLTQLKYDQLKSNGQSDILGQNKAMFLQKLAELNSIQKSIATQKDKLDEKLMNGVLNQINTAIEEYGKKNSYDLILGTEDGGVVLYGIEAIDLTEEILSELNTKF